MQLRYCPKREVTTRIHVILLILLDTGFRSRVRHMSVLDPTVMCYYVSEVLDAGQAGPLFKVLGIFLWCSKIFLFLFSSCSVLSYFL